MHYLLECLSYVLFLLRYVNAAIVDLYIMYVRVGLVWRRRRWRPPSMERRDLVMQLAPQSPVHSKITSNDILLSLNEAFLDRSLWKGLHATGAQPSAIVTGVSYGSIGFYTTLNLILCGFNVHGVCHSQNSLRQVQRMLLPALERQTKLHKEWAGRTGRLVGHVCDMSDLVAVSNLCTVLLRDPDLRVVVCGAGPTASAPRLSPQRLEEQFATHHVGHSLLLLRLLQHRLGQRNLPAALLPRWRFIILTCGVASWPDPAIECSFWTQDDEDDFLTRFDRYNGYCHAKMCNLLFAFALSRFIERDRRLAPFCQVSAVDPGPTRHAATRTMQIPFITDIAASFCLSSVVAALYVTDLCLSKRVDGANGHFFRMGEDQTALFSKLEGDATARMGLWVNSSLFRGTPGPAVSLSPSTQETLWRFTMSYLTSHALLDPKVFH